MSKIDRIKYNDTYYDIGGTSESSEGDSLPIGTIVEYDGTEIPDGFVEVQGEDGGDNYSYDEHIIGTWVNGKPLYRKIAQITTTRSTDYLTYDIGINANYTIVNLYGIASSVITGTPLAWYGKYVADMFIRDNKLNLKPNHPDFNNISWNIFVMYTKPTD